MTHRLILALCLILPLAGCPSSTTTPPPAATAPGIGYGSPADQQMSQILHAANALYDRLYADGIAVPPKYTPGPAEKAAFNTFGVVLTNANHVYKAFHAGTTTQQAAQAAVDAIKPKQDALQAFTGAR